MILSGGGFSVGQAEIILCPQCEEGVKETMVIYCEVNKVKLFAVSAEDCTKAGGTVTHTVNTEVKEVESGKD